MLGGSSLECNVNSCLGATGLVSFMELESEDEKREKTLPNRLPSAAVNCCRPPGPLTHPQRDIALTGISGKPA